MVKKKKVVYYECPTCHEEYYFRVKAEITDKGIKPICGTCGANLVRKVKYECT